MLFNLKKGISFGPQESIFGGKRTFFSESVVSILEYNNTISPYGCTGIDQNKITAFKKGFSESLDRRANMIYKLRPGVEINTFSLIDKKITKLESEKAGFRNLDPVIDTTATAAHPDINKAYLNALFELFQKNSLFLFWYGKNMGFHLENNNDENEYYIVETTFAPILTVINIKLDMDWFSIGLGTDINLNKAIKSSKNERLLLDKMAKEKNDYVKPKGSIYSNPKNIRFLKEKIEGIKNKSIYQEKLTPQKNIIESLPKWLKDIRVFIIPQQISAFLKVDTVKIYSSQLFLSVPRKDNLDLKKDINIFTLKLSNTDLENHPEMPML